MFCFSQQACLPDIGGHAGPYSQLGSAGRGTVSRLIRRLASHSADCGSLAHRGLRFGFCTASM